MILVATPGDVEKLIACVAIAAEFWQPRWAMSCSFRRILPAGCQNTDRSQLKSRPLFTRSNQEFGVTRRGATSRKRKDRGNLMNRGNSRASNALGFISVVSDDSGRRIGGLLVVNASGRPVEFHCTAPVKPNRAQEILYGPTLDEYLCGEQIGQALCGAMKSDIAVLLTDHVQVLALRHLIKHPMVYITAGTDEPRGDSGESQRVDQHDVAVRLPQLVTTRRGSQTLGVKFEYEDDLPPSVAVIDALASSLDICEPFARIHEAIAEAHGGGRLKSAA